MKFKLENIAKLLMVMTICAFMWFSFEAQSYAVLKQADPLASDQALFMPMILTCVALFASVVSLTFSKKFE